jgi:DNA-binding transcriptional MocR family regulator
VLLFGKVVKWSDQFLPLFARTSNGFFHTNGSVYPMLEQPKPSPTYGVFARELLPERIASRLVSLIAERHLRPGDKLPSERDLAAAMQVSRPSLREALRALAMLNVVEIRQGSGTYVTSLRPEVLVEHFDFVFALDDATFAERPRMQRRMISSVCGPGRRVRPSALMIRMPSSRPISSCTRSSRKLPTTRSWLDSWTA